MSVLTHLQCAWAAMLCRQRSKMHCTREPRLRSSGWHCQTPTTGGAFWSSSCRRAGHAEPQGRHPLLRLVPKGSSAQCEACRPRLGPCGSAFCMCMPAACACCAPVVVCERLPASSRLSLSLQDGIQTWSPCCCQVQQHSVPAARLLGVLQAQVDSQQQLENQARGSRGGWDR